MPELEPCFVCGKTGHESAMYFGVKIIGCPDVPVWGFIPGTRNVIAEDRAGSLEFPEFIDVLDADLIG